MWREAGQIAVLATALSVVLLPHESKSLGLELAVLQGFHPRQALEPFIVHNRVSLGGLLVVNGLLWWRLTQETARAGRRWSWWAICLSGGAGVASCLAFFSHGFWNRVHGVGTIVFAAALAIGLVRAWSPTGGPILRFRPKDVLRQRFLLSRLLLTLWGGGTLLGGLAVLRVGMIPVIVPTDPEFLKAAIGEVAALHKAVLPFVAHDGSGLAARWLRAA